MSLYLDRKHRLTSCNSTLSIFQFLRYLTLIPWGYSALSECCSLWHRCFGTCNSLSLAEKHAWIHENILDSLNTRDYVLRLKMQMHRQSCAELFVIALSQNVCWLCLTFCRIQEETLAQHLAGRHCCQIWQPRDCCLWSLSQSSNCTLL